MVRPRFFCLDACRLVKARLTRRQHTFVLLSNFFENQILIYQYSHSTPSVLSSVRNHATKITLFN